MKKSIGIQASKQKHDLSNNFQIKISKMGSFVNIY